jgi:hypothetical protein
MAQERRIKFRKSDGDRIAESIDRMSATLRNLDQVLVTLSAAQVKLAQDQLEVKKSLQLIAQISQDLFKFVSAASNPKEILKDAAEAILEALKQEFSIDIPMDIVDDDEFDAEQEEMNEGIYPDDDIPF